MNTIALFVATVLIWGTTWIAIAMQVGDVPVLVSIFYRFALAALLMLGGLAMAGRLKAPGHWRFVVVQALCLFCFNFVGLYNAAALIPSGLVSVVFSLASIFNAINARIFFGDRIPFRVIMAGCIGASGLVLLFWDDMFTALNADSLRGVAWAVFGTIIFSFGNMASRRNFDLGISPTTANAWGMGIGAVVLLLLVAITRQPVVPPHGTAYWAALVYLALIGSVVGFTAYLVLVKRIGSAKAGYATVAFPMVALLISTLFEGFVWTPAALAGIALTIVGNIVMFARRQKP
jgi:drug/metabolite transporter (DMT)-like permease